MDQVDVNEGDTWESIAADHSVPVTSLLLANGIDPNASPDPPATGSTVLLPDDPPDICVAPGHDHSLDTGGGATLWVRIDMTPQEARGDDGSLRLYSADGSHDVSVSIADNFVSNGDTVDLLFDALDDGATYSIDYVSSDGTAVTIVSDTAFSDLQDSAFCGGSD